MIIIVGLVLVEIREITAIGNLLQVLKFKEDYNFDRNYNSDENFTQFDIGDKNLGNI